MLFLGLGDGLGIDTHRRTSSSRSRYSTFRVRKATFEDYVGASAAVASGSAQRSAAREAVAETVEPLSKALGVRLRAGSRRRGTRSCQQSRRRTPGWARID